MGYWHPPPPVVFNPVARPFRYTRSAPPQPPIPLPFPVPDIITPSDEDAAFYGTNGPTQTTGIDGPWPNYGDLIAVGGYGAGFSKDKSPDERLTYYAKMIALRVPPEPYNAFEGDPIDGGLGADMVLPNGICLNYFDCSDATTPKRKRIWYPTQGDPRVEERDDQNTQWSGEGFDFDKDLPKLFQVAVSAIDVAGSMALAFLTVDPAIIALWHGALQQMAQAARPGGQIDPFKFITTAASITKAVPGFVDTMTNLALKNDAIASIYSEATELRAWATGQGNPMDFLQSIKQTVDHYKDILPKFAQQDFDALTKQLKIPPNLQALAKETYINKPVPPEVQNVIKTSPMVADAIVKATKAFNAGYDPLVVYSLRKLVDSLDAGSDIQGVLDWRTSFDLTLSTLIAQGPQKAARIKLPPEGQKAARGFTSQEIENAQAPPPGLFSHGGLFSDNGGTPPSGPQPQNGGGLFRGGKLFS